ncbi:uncharacterized protein HMPREF1541_05492 [Cyphellophora europaea CBS 101466]|uniref:Midasin n=1 Tax=Cyphellophora europaea (strain CBS 101466) TaxID=1220924 RepID=W2RU75_CYPE1|nr:uncharacterized protein HMPREF1541_05492 [Cyphellophora europaea CBS 101466]ETN39269.1 hypothetical protein HMPREF1541_05492 [Cyphellophora europaea CBS 101466]
MDDISVDCSWADAQLQQDSSLALHLPPELRTQIIDGHGERYLKALSQASRLPQCTDKLYALYEPAFVDIAARWTTLQSYQLGDAILTVSTLARLLPFAPYLRPHAFEILGSQALQDLLSKPIPSGHSNINNDQLLALLTAVFRLLSYRRDDFERCFHPVFFTSLLRHESLPIRHLSVECLCLVMHFADAFCDDLLAMYIGKQPVLGRWEGISIDYRLLKLWEERRWKQAEEHILETNVRRLAERGRHEAKPIQESDLHVRVALVGGVLVPRTENVSAGQGTFVLTPSAESNLRLLGQVLLEEKPVLLAGPAGSGKSSLIVEAARLLNKQESMITLHLNEQTDAKSMIGLYMSSSTGDSFVWQPGVLTRAMQQGRWVLIEDIDRAPAEVLGVLRPVIESGSLFIPNRRQTVKAAEGFRLIATIRTSGDAPSSIAPRHSWLTNTRLWSVVTARSYENEEIGLLLDQRYPDLASVREIILDVHRRLDLLYRDNAAFKIAQNRLPALRDLLKWCKRIQQRVSGLQLKLATNPVPESFQIDVFKDGANCYASHLSDPFLYNKVAESVAEAMNIAPQQKDFYLNPIEDIIADTATTVRIGRSVLPKISSRRSQARKRPFANTGAARRGLENVAAGISFSEACLLVGETGVGKTSLVQHIASLVGQTLHVVNLSQQSEVSDLLGGLKPVTTRSLVLPLIEQFNILFDDTFSASRNKKFQAAVNKAVTKENWSRLAKLWQEAVQMADKALKKTLKPSAEADGSAPATKRRKLETSKVENLRQRWSEFNNAIKQIHGQLEKGDKSHTFTFVEGRLVQAVRHGEWLLLDEINLASSDTLDHVVSLLGDVDGQKPYLLLTEAGNVEKVVAHPNFKVFAAMNPATDAGKKDLPPALRSRFTELYVQSGDDDVDDLVKIIRSYLGDNLGSDKRAALDLARTYQEVQHLNQQHRLTDGAGDAPHFSIRSMVRCLLYVNQHSKSHGLRRSMYEGFAMSFFTALSRESEALTLPVVEKHLFSNVKNVKSFLAQQPKLAHAPGEFIAFRHHLIGKGPMSPDLQPHYIRTSSVERNLMNLARAASMRRFPILLQGPTSAGKTSMVEYLAKLSGNKFVRINNHEHTDLQEYLGSYMSDIDGKLRFKEGVLVDALRQGYWVVLDELNLAPSDVLEALNRLLDDNRELLIPETQEIVRPHPNFMLFATQNPAGMYGGRKRLSRAFRNRFLEIHFDDIPEDELEVILRERAQIAPSFCTQIVAVYKRLSLQRQSSRLFEQRNSFATLRDLFRWASRPVDDRQQLAQHGFMLLGERVREASEREIVKNAIEETMKVKLDEAALYGTSALSDSIRETSGIVWTTAMRRLFVLVSEALKNKEPVLLVGETGCGKTQICQVVATAFGRPLNIYNAHTNTETGDLIGSQRPIRSRAQMAADVIESVQPLVSVQMNGAHTAALDADDMIARFAQVDQSNADPELVLKAKLSIGAYQALFAWSDGSLVRSMKIGEYFLLDEISLADDSVLERLNSVLEPARTLVLAEKGSVDNVVVARPDFQFLATMNPGGDYGKRELSAALRNRMTEIWVPPLSQDGDVLPIVKAVLGDSSQHLAPLMLTFTAWFKSTFHNSANTTIPLRDLLTWAKFVNAVPELGLDAAFVHGAGLVFVDSLGANPAGMTTPTTTDVASARRLCIDFLQSLIGSIDVTALYNARPTLTASDYAIGVGSFQLQRVPGAVVSTPELVFDAPTTLKNTMRIVRALQLDRPILLEGNPGVGKTAIVTALAQAVGKPFTRINLSDQTDLMDLFGADAPSENESLGKFSWKDGPLLQAMQTGGWVLLDEMNLASQSVLEGLNSCLDHRKEAYIAELDKTFTCHPGFKLFAAQNPHHQGGGRKGLPASFVNRFTVVYADPFLEQDLMAICRVKYPHVSESQLATVVRTVAAADDLMQHGSAFYQGGPWEVNLRDVSRWLALCEKRPKFDPMYHFDTVVRQRFRSVAQATPLSILEKQVTGDPPFVSSYSRLTSQALQIGTAILRRSITDQHLGTLFSIRPKQLPQAKSIISAVEHGWPVIVTGPADSGKTELIRFLAAVSGNELVEISMNADIDTMDLLGGFEQYDSKRDLETVKGELSRILSRACQEGLMLANSQVPMGEIVSAWQMCQSPLVDAAVLLSALSSLAKYEQIEGCIKQLQGILNSDQDGRSQFVWNDGILIDAIQSGSWVVLDNANLCNASVLDRLNSLLEPDGHLVISEQHGSDGGVRTITPHPNFRIFLTMNPKSGELSRAMRNRSLEVYLDSSDEALGMSRTLTYPVASKMSRLRDLCAQEQLPHLHAFADNIAFEDAELITASSNEENTSDIFKALEPVIRHQLTPSSSFWDTPVQLQALADENQGPLAQINAQPQFLLVNEPLFGGCVQQSRLEQLRDAANQWQLRKYLTRVSVQLDHSVQRASSLVMKELTALDRSALVLQKKKTKVPDTPAVFPFAEALLKQLFRSLKGMKGMPTGYMSKSTVTAVAHFLLDFVDLAHERSVDPARVQAYLQIGHDIALQLFQSDNQLAHGFQQSLQHFDLVMSKYGRGLQRFWESWGSQVPESLEQLEIKLALEDLLVRFDRAIETLPQSRADMGLVKMRLLDAANSSWALPGADQAVARFSESIGDLERQAVSGNAAKIYFVDVFEQLLCRLQLGHVLIANPRMLSLLPFVQDMSQMASLSDGKHEASEALAQLAAVKGMVDEEGTNLASEVFSKLSTIKLQPIRALDHLKEELLQIAQTFASSSSLMTRSMLDEVAKRATTVCAAMLDSHRHLLSDTACACINSTEASDFDRLANLTTEGVFIASGQNMWLADIYDAHFRPAIALLACHDHRADGIGTALVHLAAAALTLIVPDKPFDPALLPRIVSERHVARRAELQQRIASQINFNQKTSGQDSSLVSRLLEQDLKALGPAPHVMLVARPKVSSLARVHEEFSLIIRTVLQGTAVHDLLRESRGDDPEIFHTEATKFRAAIERIGERLNSIDRAYDDIVVPVKQLLQVLGVGIELVVSGQGSHGPKKAVSNAVVHLPLMGPTPRSVEQWSLQNLKKSEFERLEWIRHFGLGAALESKRSIAQTGARLDEYLTVVDSFYVQWKERLREDQAEAETKSRYYAYRGGGDEDTDAEQREMAELFPVFEDAFEMDEQASPGVSTDNRNIAQQLAYSHNLLFGSSPSSAPSVRDHVHSVLQELSRRADGISVPLRQSLPAMLLQMEKETQLLEELDRDKLFNIYADPNIREVRQLQKLLRAVEERFRELAARWPEHAIPTDVLAICQELMSFKLNEPLAKLLTKTEKLLEAVAQWQSVASREWSVLGLVEEITALIISWRRLELSSWSSLLDLEKRKHDDNAASWFFIAYESIVYNSRAIVDQGGDLHAYCNELIKTLEEFLRSATLGQYIPRLTLLQGFGVMLRELSRENDKLVPIATCVTNIVQHYERYGGHIEKTMQTSRADLEKAITEQIKLASWKDTNVTALKDSARRSHHKLFKIVRKYRALLNQPISSLKSEELQDEMPAPAGEVPPPEQSNLQPALEVCSQKIFEWQLRPERLRNPTVAAAGMRRIYTAQEGSLDVRLELNSFREDLGKSIKELRKETPSTLTEENTALVKHLRERKRRLLADTIKDVSHMGIRRNLATGELQQQASLAAILSAVTPQSSVRLLPSTVDQAFHEVLDAMPTARNALTEHSPDLTDGEIRRGIGLLEGLLSHSIKQREEVLKCNADLERLKNVQSMMSDLCVAPTSIRTVATEVSGDADLRLRLKWLPSILGLAVEVLQFQANAGKLDVESLISTLQAAADDIRGFKEAFAELRTYPNGLMAQRNEDLKQEIWHRLQELGVSFQQWHESEPNVGYLIDQLLPWTVRADEPVNGTTTAGINHLSLNSIDRTIRDATDTVFVALQQLTTVKSRAVADTEDAGWLVQNDKHFKESIRALHLPEIAEKLSGSLDNLQHLQHENLPLAASLVAVASPIFEQFYLISKHAIDKQVAVHVQTTQVACFLAKTFATVAREGFCTPSEPSDGQEQAGKLESGTGLGEGEGAEDISKDVGADEDLSEFAQGEKGDQEDEIEGADDAVDMGADDLEGQMGDAGERQEDGDESGSEGEEGDMDEETGSVDDLDPNTVDEKMWDEAQKEGEKDEKELKGEKQQGEKTQEQTEAGEEREEGENEGEVDEGEAGEELEEDDQAGEGKAEAEHADPHLQEEQALELPEELQLTGEEEGKSDGEDDEEMNELSDVEQPPVDEGMPEEIDSVDQPDREEQKATDEQGGEQDEQDDDVEGKAQDDDIVEDQLSEGAEDQEQEHEQRDGEMQLDVDEQDGGEKGAANQLQDDVNPEQSTEGQNQVEQAQDDKQAQGATSADNDDQGESGKGVVERGRGRDDSNPQRQQKEALRKLADVLEQWHQRREILDPAEEKQEARAEQDFDLDMKDADFEHLDEEEDEGDAQALGAADAGQTQNVDLSKAIQDEEAPVEDDSAMPDIQDLEEEQEQATERLNRLQANADANAGAERREDGAFVPDQDHRRQQGGQEGVNDESDVSDTADGVQQLALETAPPSPPTSSADAAQLWNYCSTITHQFALILTEQLRLILHPTTATKLRGDFRTGKRLNLKRIIPYIASGYKRDKIWMRRSVPSKRNYQILLAVDDSKSMAESGADLLALQTTALLCKSLAMLEVGEVSVVGFGEQEKVTVAHPFGSVWSSEAGVSVFEKLGFRQQGTNVRRLVRQSLDMLRDARLKAPGGGDELWQLQIIVSDGHCSDHDEIRRLVRQAKEERVMIVFVILDNINKALGSGQRFVTTSDAAAATATGGRQDASREINQDRTCESILDLKEAVFEEGPDGQMKVVTRRYLERFPFEYYLVVRDVRELPGVLGRCLRGWFAEVEGR